MFTLKIFFFNNFLFTVGGVEAVVQQIEEDEDPDLEVQIEKKKE